MMVNAERNTTYCHTTGYTITVHYQRNICELLPCTLGALVYYRRPWRSNSLQSRTFLRLGLSWDRLSSSSILSPTKCVKLQVRKSHFCRKHAKQQAKYKYSHLVSRNYVRQCYNPIVCPMAEGLQSSMCTSRDIRSRFCFPWEILLPSHTKWCDTVHNNNY